MKSLLIAACVLASSTLTVADDKIVELQKAKVDVLKQSVKELRDGIASGVATQRELDDVKAQMLYAQLELAESVGDTKSPVALHKELVAIATDNLSYINRQVQKGTASPAALRKANVELLDRKIALLKAEKADNTPGT